MSRKPLLLALIVLLALAVAWVVISARRAPSPATSAPLRSANVRQSVGTPTRVLFPRDLQILESTSEWTRQTAGVNAQHKVVIRNKGKVAYRNPSLEFSYFDGRGKMLDTRAHTVDQLLRAGETVSLTRIELIGLPATATKSALKLIHADLAPP